MIAAFVYILLFSLLILFFKKKQKSLIPRWAYLSAFLVKIAFGFFLTYIYTSYYPDRKTADIFKYYDDAKVIAQALPEKPGDYLRIISGIGNDNAYFDTTYYTKMNNWYKRYDFGTYNDNHTIIRFNALVMPIAFGSFHVHTVFMCFLSFLGLCALTHVFCRIFPQKKWLTFFGVFFIPSVMFWGSGVLKEGILLFSIGILFFSFYYLVIDKKRPLLNIILFLVSILLLLLNKNYLLLCIIPPLLCYYLATIFSVKRVGIFFLLFHFILIAAVFTGARFILQKDPIRTIAYKQKDFINLAHGGVFLLNDHRLVRIEPEQKNELEGLTADSCRLKPGISYMHWKLDNFNDTLYESNNTDTANYKLIWDLPKAGSLIQEKAIPANFISFVGFAPKALYNAFIQPSLFRARSVVEKMAAIENMLIAAFLVVCLFFSDWKNTNVAMLNLCVYAVMILFLIIGYTTPVAGAIVRYKVPMLPFVMLAGINLVSIEKLKQLPVLRSILK